LSNSSKKYIPRRTLGFKKKSITLAQLFSISLIGLIALLILLFYLLFHTSHDSIIRASDNLRAAASREFADKVTSFLSELQQVEEGINVYELQPHIMPAVNPSSASFTTFFFFMHGL
jgi:hypothetical protein